MNAKCSDFSRRSSVTAALSLAAVLGCSVAEAVHGGWADVGICVKLSAEEAGLNFLPVRQETLDFCFANTQQHDPRVQALIRLLRSRSHRRLVSELPGYDARETGAILKV